jgi:KTSC domain
MLEKPSIEHKKSTHSKTTYDEDRRILQAYFTDGAVYQFLDVPKRIFSDLQQLEENKSLYENIEDNDVISDYFYSKLWETLAIKGKYPNRYAVKKNAIFLC